MNMKRRECSKLKRIAALGLSAVLAFPTSMISFADKKDGKETLPKPAYEFTFDEASSAGKIANSGTKPANKSQDFFSRFFRFLSVPFVPRQLSRHKSGFRHVALIHFYC